VAVPAVFRATCHHISGRKNKPQAAGESNRFEEKSKRIEQVNTVDFSAEILPPGFFIFLLYFSLFFGAYQLLGGEELGGGFSESCWFDLFKTNKTKRKGRERERMRIYRCSIINKNYINMRLGPQCTPPMNGGPLFRFFSAFFLVLCFFCGLKQVAVCWLSSSWWRWWRWRWWWGWSSPCVGHIRIRSLGCPVFQPHVGYVNNI